MRLVYITEKLPFGKIESFFLPELRQLLKAGHQVLLVPAFPSDRVADAERQALLPITYDVRTGARRTLLSIVTSFARCPLTFLKLALLPFRSRTAKQLVRNACMMARACVLAEHLRRWRPDHVHAHWANYTATLGMVTARLTRTPWSMTAHRYDIAFDNLLRLKLEDAVFVRFIGEHSLEAASSVLGSEVPGNTIVIHMGVDLPSVQNRQDQSDHVTVLCPAALIALKGHKYLLEALIILRERGLTPRVWFAGDGELREELGRAVVEAGLENQVFFLGHLPHETILSMYAHSQVQVVVLPSTVEGIPVSLMEAMSYGVPVVATDAGGTSELLREGAGVLIQKGDAMSLADGLEELLRDRTARRTIGKRGEARVRSSFGVQNVVEQLVKQIETASAN